MKKIVLSLAGVLAATAFAPEASAIPAYARQVGMACTACHAQHFPVLNSFGRAFKAGGYTMMGSQGKIEGDHLSLPDTLNASIVLKLRYVEDNNNTANPTGALEKGPITGAGTTARTSTSDGQWQFADEFALLLGGRISENVGFFLEGNMMGGALAAGFKIPMVYDMGGAKLSVIPFFTDAMGPQMGYEMSSGGVLRSVRWSEARREVSAVQYNADRNCTSGNKALAGQVALDAAAPAGAAAAGFANPGDCGAASGFTFAASNDMGFVAYTKFSPSFAPGGGGQALASTDLGNNYIRIAATPTVGGWAMLIGAGKMSGDSWSNVSGAQVATDQTFFDFEAHGEVGGNELGVYAQHARAPKGTAAIMNSYNSETAATSGDRKAWTIGADYSVIPHVLHLGAAYRNADNGKAATVNGDDALSLQAIYDLSQNVALHAVYTKYSGNSHVGTVETNQTLLMLEAAW